LKYRKLKHTIKKTLQELREGRPPGAFTVSGTYNDVKPYYNFRSQGPNPGAGTGRGFNYESEGPLGVNYFMEDENEGPNPWAVCTSSLGLEGKKRKDYTSNEKDNYEKCVLSMKKEIKENDIRRIVDRVINENELKESSHGGSYMAKKQLWGIAEKAQEMAERLPDGVQLEDWMESHIAKADSMMDSVYDSFDYDNQTEMPGFEGTMDALKGLTIREQDEVIATNLYKQDTSRRDGDTGGIVASTAMLDIMDGKLDNLTNTVNDLYDNLSRRWN
jgi:hypothetical protein|tara:strand:+ start:2030 stop:2851 length:822 start_codon:yes stop_codon:yes gene_type:complete